MNNIDMNYYRICKYDNAYRDENGYYTKLDEWTSIGDIGIGKTSDGRILTKKEYYATENHYIQCIQKILDAVNEPQAQICYLETWPYKKRKWAKQWYRRQKLSGGLLNLFMSDCLRERCYGVLKNDKFVWDVGWDYYMHVGCVLEPSVIEEIASSEGLFITEWYKFYPFEP